MNTFLLDPGTWDLVIDFNGNIAAVTEPYSLAQDAACAIKTYLGECFYDITIGVQYSNILGKRFNINYIKAQLIAAAETVPGVVSAQVFLISLTNRVLSGQVQTTDKTGVVSAASFAVTAPLYPSPSPFGT